MTPAPSLDEDDVRVRPRRGKSRPRSKDRPDHAQAEPGRVLAVDRGRFTVAVRDRTVYAVKARELGRKGVVVGDEVWLTGDVWGGPDALARIVRLRERRTLLRRSADDADPVERVLVANADQLAIVVALAEPDPSPGFVDRCLVAAYDGGLTPLLVLTKSDLADPAALVADYAGLELATVVSGQATDGGLTGPALAELRTQLGDRWTVLIGHSGVGKSTLVNELVPAAERSVGAVNAVTGRGRHTSTAAVALPLPGGGWIVDTPGVRSFGLAHVIPARVIESFPDFHQAGVENCPRGCPHESAAAGCELDAFVAAGGGGSAGAQRLASLRRLLENTRQ